MSSYVFFLPSLSTYLCCLLHLLLGVYAPQPAEITYIVDWASNVKQLFMIFMTLLLLLRLKRMELVAAPLPSLNSRYEASTAKKRHFRVYICEMFHSLMAEDGSNGQFFD